MTKPFIHDDFLLHTDAARDLYHSFAKAEPIYDYHCHLPQQLILENHKFADLAEIWLGGVPVADGFGYRLGEGFSDLANLDLHPASTLAEGVNEFVFRNRIEPRRDGCILPPCVALYMDRK